MSALNGEVIVFDQHLGGAVELRVYGDEFYARYETLDGYTVVYDVDRGQHCYATLAAGRFVSTGVPPHKPVPVGIKRHLKEAPDVRNERFGRRYEQLRPRETESGSNATRTLGPDGGLLGGRKFHHAHVRGLTLMVDFDDVQANIRKADLEEMLNGDNYSGNGNFCSVRKYFEIVSAGKLIYSNTVVGPIKLSKRRSHYISNLLVKEALDIAVRDFGVDLSQFDSRNEGIVDAINVLYAGDSQYSGELWPHNSVETLRYGSVSTHYYLLTGLGSEKVDLRIGTICHENGHLLCRFPDMYDYGQRDGDHENSQGIGRYCLMGSGNHLNERRTPSPICGYLRLLAGWADNVVDLNSPGVQHSRHGDYATVMRYRTDKPNEFFIIENRSRVGLDAHLPSSGLAIYHCDTLGSNEWQAGTRNNHYQCGLLQADGHLDLENNRNAGDFQDLFAGVNGVALSHSTMPSSREWDDTDSGLLVSDIGEAGQNMSFAVGRPRIDDTSISAEVAPNLLIPDNDPAGISSGIAIARAGNATSIAVEVFIIHSWIGDLKVVLRAPDGSVAVLHNLEGRNGDDINKTWKSGDLQALDTLQGAAIEGQWTLWISDTASADVGRLVRWSLALGYEAVGGNVKREVRPALRIPDMDFAGVSSTLAIDVQGSLRDIRIDVDLEHTYIGDLQLDLRCPSGREVRIHDNEGQWRDNIKRFYDIGSTPALRALLDQSIAGQWTLSIRDVARGDIGTLHQWGVELSY